jgi:hypothetical protein
MKSLTTLKKLIFLSLLSLTVCKSILNAETNEEEISASIYHLEGDKFEIKYQYDVNAIAYAKYKKSLLTTGWDFLSVSSSLNQDEKYTDDLRAYAFGYLEGYITAERIWSHYINTKQYYLYEKKGEIPENLREFIDQNRAWITKMTKDKKDVDEYWFQVYLIQRQLEGMIEGYNSNVAINQKLSYVEFSIINASNDTRTSPRIQ